MNAEGVPVNPKDHKPSVAVNTPEPVISDLAAGARGDEVLRLQQRLKVLGFFFTAEDGIYGANTKNAVFDFENYLRLLEQDEIDREIAAMQTPEPPVTATPLPTEEISPETTQAVQTLSPTENPAPMPTPTPAPTPETPADGMADRAIQEILYGDANALYRRDAQKDDVGADITRIQRRLVALNYLNDEPDGSYGINTENAIKAFQTAHDLNGTGVADRATQEILYSIEALRAEKPVYNQLYLGVTGEDVKAVQRQLRLLGFTNSKVSGTYDQKTQAAVMQLETYLHQLDLIERGVSLVQDAAAPVPEEILNRQGEITGDPKINPYEIMPGETTDMSTETPSPMSTATVAPTEAADADGRTTAEPKETVLPEGDPTASAENSPQIHPMPTTTPKVDVQANSFVPTGIMTAEMQVRLLEEGIPVYMQTVQKGDAGEQVMRMQRRLYSLGYLTANGVDGILGKGSEEAVRSFQRRNKLEETGVADQQMQTLLFSEDAIRAIKTYQIEISVEKQRVYVYTHDENDQYNILVQEFKCSTGTKSNPTPLGTFTNTGAGARWHYFKKFECWAQYAYYINGDIMFHSVLYDEQDESTLREASVSQLGKRASHGCVRLQVADAEWIYRNCAAGTTVIVY